MQRDDVTCPECGKTFPGQHMLSWHRDAVHPVPVLSNRGTAGAGLAAEDLGWKAWGYCGSCGGPLDSAGGCRRCAQSEESRIWQEVEHRKKIRNAVVAGSISTAVTVLMALTQVLDSGYGGIIDAFIIFALTMGVLFRNRACAVLLFVYWVIAKLVMLGMGMVGWMGLPLGVLFGYFFYGAIPATFQLHKIRMARREYKKRNAVGQQV